MFDVEELKRANPIEDVVSRWVPLNKKGSVLQGFCPFHKETKPSFTVWPSDGHFYCFGCQERGDVLTFVMRILDVDFKEACRVLGARELPELKAPPPRADPRPEVVIGPAERTALALAMKVYHARLWALSPADDARIYVTRRKMDPDAIRRFGIGWCSGQDLIPAARFSGVSVETLLRAGLIRERTTREHWEFLSNRLVFPERDPDGVMYLVGRPLDDREPKYLGLAGISKPLYGLGTIDRQKPVAVVEGVFCCYSLQNHGVQAVATMGTALSSENAAALKMIPDLWFIPDNDEPDPDTGLRAGDEAVKQWRAAVGHGSVVRLPEHVGDVNDLDRLEELEEWLETWATWRRG
jgi:DNA primase